MITTATEARVIDEIAISDLEVLFPLARHFFSDADLVGRFIPECFVASWTQLISSGSGVIFIIRSEGGVVGALGAIKYPDPNDGEIVCSEAFWYVDPDHRGNGVRLLRHFEDWAKKNDAKRITMVYLVDSMPEKLDEFYRRMGYTKKEVTYIKKL